MTSENDEIVIRLDWKHLIVITLIAILAISALGTYVNALMTYRPNTVSQYGPPIVFPPIIPNKAPTADAGPDQNAFVNQTVYLDASASKDEDGTIESYTWSLGDGTSATGVNVTHRYATEGTYQVNLTVTDDYGDSDSAIITITVRVPTPELISPLTPEESATILEGISLNASLYIMMNLNATQAAEIAEELNTTTLLSMIKAAINLDQTHNISRILIEMRGENATRAILDLDPASSTQILESMLGLNTTRCALIVETGVSIDQNRTAEILELMETQQLLELLVEVSRLRFSPSTVATIIEALSIEKSIELSRAWIATANVQELAVVYGFLSSETLNNVFGNLTVAERSSVYPHLTNDTIALIQVRLLPLPDVTLTSLTITRIDSRGYLLNGTIENQGNVETGTFIAELMIDEELARQFDVPDLFAGNLTTFTYEWRPTSRGAYTLKAIADPTNTIKEIDEANNLLTRSYGVELPDLTVSFTTVPTDFVERRTYTFGVEISNIGEEDATDFNLTLQASGIIVERGRVRWISFTVGTTQIARLHSGSTEAHNFRWEPDVAGAYTFIARADPQEQVLEGVRQNNDAELQIEVEERPQIWPYLLITAVAALAATGILLLVRPQTFSFLSRLRPQAAE